MPPFLAAGCGLGIVRARNTDGCVRPKREEEHRACAAKANSGKRFRSQLPRRSPKRLDLRLSGFVEAVLRLVFKPSAKKDFMSGLRRIQFSFALFLVLLSTFSRAQTLELKNAETTATFGPRGLLSIQDAASGTRLSVTRDAWQLEIDEAVLRSDAAQPVVAKAHPGEVTYAYDLAGYRIQVVYTLRAGWKFASKQIRVLSAPRTTFTVRRVVPWDLTVDNAVDSDFVPSSYVPQFGATIEQSRKSRPGKDFGEFLRLAGEQGALLTVENPYLEVRREGQTVRVSYSPQLEWRQEWGAFASDAGLIGSYRLSGRRKPREMALEWHLPPAQMPADGMDEAEIEAFTGCVRAQLIAPSPAPVSVQVGWTLNDYQIDVGTPEGVAEYKRIIDTASALGVQTVLYAPGNSKLAERTQSADSWSWEYVLWLNLGEKIRKGEWDPGKDAIPASVAEMVAYARQKHVGLLAYVYPSAPFAANPSWLVKRPEKDGDSFTYATLASREFQDYLIRNLIVFQKRTGIAGYSFDYTWLDLPGSSSYAQWYGWRRVMETLRRAAPSLIVDGRQSYQTYGPWSWLAGNYPHPTGNDEQPESFKPYPDLHFDRVSADRMRFVNYWYRNYQFAPAEIVPGYATHQTERSRNLAGKDAQHPAVEMMYSRYRPRDWDYLGYRYSFLSSIAAGGWNNVVNMIPARDTEEAKHFSAQDKAWIRGWLDWTVQHKEYLRHTRTILEQPALGYVDGTAAIVGDRGYLFLFNPNYKQLPAEFSLDGTIGLSKGEKFLLREVFPQKGRLLGKPGAGAWSRGDAVRLDLDGTSATVLEVIPFEKTDHPMVLNAANLHSERLVGVVLTGDKLAISHAAGEPGTVQNLGVLLPAGSRVSSVTVNGQSVQFTQTGSYAEAQVRFAGTRFAQAQQIALASGADGSLAGAFVVPQRVLDQLAERKAKWPIPWAPEDYESTWLAPERLLLFVQAADGTDASAVTGAVDGRPLKIQPAYSSSRADASCFVGYYADLSDLAPDVRHTIELHLPQGAPGQLQGVFFDNVTPQLTESLAP